MATSSVHYDIQCLRADQDTEKNYPTFLMAQFSKSLSRGFPRNVARNGSLKL